MPDQSFQLDPGETFTQEVDVGGAASLRITGDPGGARGVGSANPPISSYTLTIEKQTDSGYQEVGGSPIESSNLDPETTTVIETTSTMRVIVENTGSSTGTMELSTQPVSADEVFKELADAPILNLDAKNPGPVLQQEPFIPAGATVYDVREFGADPTDPAVDDNAALQDTIDTIESGTAGEGGGLVKFPRGTITNTQPLDYSGIRSTLEDDDAFGFIGVGQNTTRFRDEQGIDFGNSGGTPFQNFYLRDFTWEWLPTEAAVGINGAFGYHEFVNLEIFDYDAVVNGITGQETHEAFFGPKAGDGGGPFTGGTDEAGNPIRSKWTGLQIHDMLNMDSVGTISETVARDIIISNCSVSNLADSVRGFAFDTSENVDVRNCYFNGLNDWAVEVQGGTVQNVIIENGTDSVQTGEDGYADNIYCRDMNANVSFDGFHSFGTVVCEDLNGNSVVVGGQGKVDRLMLSGNFGKVQLGTDAHVNSVVVTATATPQLSPLLDTIFDNRQVIKGLQIEGGADLSNVDTLLGGSGTNTYADIAINNDSLSVQRDVDVSGMQDGTFVGEFVHGVNTGEGTRNVVNQRAVQSAAPGSGVGDDAWNGMSSAAARKNVTVEAESAIPSHFYKADSQGNWVRTG